MICNSCGNEGAFSIAATTITKVYLKRTCKTCCKVAVAQHKILKRTHTVTSEKCQCCGKSGKLILDHCHLSGAFRGWLCQSCNVGIGKLGDSEEAIRRALDYIVRSKNIEVGQCSLTKDASA
jgi:hypothetical protein